MSTLNVQSLKELVRRYHLAISTRRLGQHFLVDSHVLERIAATLGATSGEKVLEIGSGLGALTESLLRTGSTVYGVERDARFVRVLTDRFRDSPQMQLIQSDILRVDLASYALGEPKSLLIAGNIPYSMTSPILEFLLKNRRWVRKAILTIQKEVALRIVAKPGTKTYSSLTLFVQVAFKPSIAFHIPPHAFYPQPKVTSLVLVLDPLPEPVVPEKEEADLLRLIRIIFTHRRKTILNALTSLDSHRDKEDFRRCLEQSGIDPIRRPETFSLQELIGLNKNLRTLFPPSAR